MATIAMEKAVGARRARLLGFAACAIALLADANSARAVDIDVPAFLVDQNGIWPDVAPAPDGSLAIVWSQANNANREGYARRYAADGTPLAPASSLGNYFQYPSIAPLAGGGFVVGSLYTPTESAPVLGHLLDASAAPVGPPFWVEATGDKIRSVAVTGLPSGPVFVWDQNTIWSRRFDSSGLPLAPPRFVEDDDAGVFYQPVDVAPLPDGGFVVGWYRVLGGSSRLRIYRADGAPVGQYFGPDFTLTHIAAYAGGIGVIGYRNNSIYLQRYSLDGLPLGSETPVYTGIGVYSDPDLDFDSFGNVAVVSNAYNASFSAIQAIFVDTANQAGDPQYLYGIGSLPRVTHLKDGQFAAVWFGSGTRAAIFTSCVPNSAACGDGVIDAPCEQCDAGAANSDTTPNRCRTNCLLWTCGDGVADAADECDDGNRVSGDGCDQFCRTQFCGSNRIEGGETCDDGGLVDGDGCDSNCSITACGNGVVTAGEECDDNNIDNTDGCDANCLIEECGNGRAEGIEACDDGGFVDGDGCDSNCTVTACGNGVLALPEECDDGNTVDSDGCDRVCLIEQCGNGRIEGDEPCDDGNPTPGDGCEPDCTLSPRVDPVLGRARPLRLVIAPGLTSASKTFSITLRNGDPKVPQTYRLRADAGTCPAAAIAMAPDFSASIAGIQDSVVLNPGQKARARLTVRIDGASIAAVDRDVPYRCTIQVTSSAAAANAVDETPANGRLSIEVDTFDRNAPHPAGPEFHLGSARGMRLVIPAGRVAVERAVRIGASAIPSGAAFTFQASDGDCPTGTVSVESQNPNGSAVVLVRAGRAFFTTPNALSPARCNAVISASGPADTDARNNATTLSVEVDDRNDQP